MVSGDLAEDRLDVSMDGPGCCHAECYRAGDAGLASEFDGAVASHGDRPDVSMDLEMVLWSRGYWFVLRVRWGRCQSWG